MSLDVFFRNFFYQFDFVFQVINYLQDIVLDLCDRVELYGKRVLLFDEFNIEEEINNIFNKR